MRHLIPVDVNVTEKSPYFRGVSRRLMTVSLAAVFLSACAATDQEVGMVLGSTAAGAAIGALGGAALDPTDRNRGATSGALGGAAIGAAVGYANVAQRRQDQYQRSNSHYYNPPPPPPRNYRGERCVVTEFTDGYGRVTTTETCTAQGPPPSYRYY